MSETTRIRPRRSATAPAAGRGAGTRTATRSARSAAVGPGGPGRRRPRPGFWAGRTPWLHALDAGAVLALAALSVAGFHVAYGGDLHYLVAGLTGAVLGLGVAYASSTLRPGVLVTAAAAFLAYLLAGGLVATPDESLAGVVPTLGSLRTLLLGIVVAWKDNLTVAAPLGTGAGMLVVPYLGTFVCCLVAGLTAWRLRGPYWPLIPLGLLFGLGIAFGTNEAYLALPRGVAFAVVAVLWASFRRHAARTETAHIVSGETTVPDTASARAARLRHVGLGAVVLAAATTLALVLGPALTAGAQRDVLRDRVVPPFDPRNYISPLSSFRSLVKDQRDTTLFTVTGLPEGGRVRLAALDSYDGTVANIDQGGSGSFAKVGDAASLARGDGADAGGTDYSLGVTVGGYTGFFVPGGRTTTGIAFSDSDGAASEGLYFNSLTDTAITTAGLAEGDSYTVQVEEPARPDDGQLAQAEFAQVGMPSADAVPQVLQAKAGDILGDSQVPIERVRTLESYFQKFGAFSNGLVAEGQVPSLSGHGAGRLRSMLTAKQMVGDDEQYAVTMALMARHLGMPARVVMGFYPEQPVPAGTSVEIKGKDVHAWVEVAFAGHGWVAFDPTPPKNNVPIPPDPQAQSKPRPQVLQPPPPPQAPVELPPDSRPDVLDEEQKKNDLWLLLGPILAVIGVVLIPIAVLALPLLLIAWLKLRRRRRRLEAAHPADRVSGGWSEVTSYATDLGASLDAWGTRRENAAALGESFPESARTTTALAQRADAAVFGAGSPSDDEVRAYWADVDGSLEQMRGGLTFWARQRARFSPRSLVLDARRALAFRQGIGQGAPGQGTTWRDLGRRARRGGSEPGEGAS
ncbi:transglutaminaseTgpA domain-containing protein [Sinomonas mesophila]|uniref:transglutaminase family protein n=1 Tax=Sinomonas mesophila TaxID=1531955 RepID=UPI000984706B|nr:transglutaminase domain-containing protein [Sinomonas mesophila]